MTWEIGFVVGLTVLALLLFTWERMRIDATAILVMVALMVSGILTPGESLAGFSNIATVTVAAMFVLSAGVRQTGALSSVGTLLARLGGQRRSLALVVLVVVVGVVSGFINNTAAVALLIPVVVGLARDLGTSPTQLLMPLSFASMFGGVATLIGTSTNLLVNSIAVDRGFDEFGLFELTPLGVILFAVGAAYLFVVFPLIPARREGSGQELTERFEMAAFLTQVRVERTAACVGETLGDNVLVRQLDVEIIDLERETQVRSGVDRDLEISAGDVLRVRTPAADIARLLAFEGITLVPPAGGEALDARIETETETLVEAVIAPNSQLAGRTVADVNFPGRHSAQVLALRQHGELERSLPDAVLHAGNSLLLKIDREALAELQENEDFFIASEVVVPNIRRHRMPIAIGVIVAVVLVAAFDVLPIVVAAVSGSFAMVLTGVLTAEEAYDAINWKVVFLLAGILPLGTALEQTGAAELLAERIVGLTFGLGPAAVLAGFFLLTQLLTAILSNNASAVLMAPIAIGAAESLGADPRPFLVAVMVAASMSFMTPIGYQTNTMIYGPGQFRFVDFARIGTPLTILVWIVASLLIPVLWPL